MSYYSRYGTDRDRDRERDNFYQRRREWNRHRGRGWHSHGPNNWRWNRESYRDRPRRDPQVVLVRRTQVSPEKDEVDGRYTVNSEKYPTVDRQLGSTSNFESPYSQDGNHRRDTPYLEYSPANANYQHKVVRQTSTAETSQHAVPYNHQNSFHVPPTHTVNRNTDNESENIMTIKQELIETCISNFKIRGDYDRIRKECLLDIDTKPAFINVKTKVADITSQFLGSLRFLPNMDKSKMRENLKQAIAQSNGFQSGVETLVNQILMPKVSSIIRPTVEEEIYRCLNIERIPNTDTSEMTASVEEQSGSNNNSVHTVVKMEVENGLNTKKVDSPSICEDDAQLDPVECNRSIQFELNAFPTDCISTSDHENAPVIISRTESTMKNGSADTYKSGHRATTSDSSITEPELINETDFTSIKIKTIAVVNLAVDINIETKEEVNLAVDMDTETGVVSTSVAHALDLDMTELTLSEDDHNCSNAESEEESPEFEKIGEISPPRIEMDLIPYESLNLTSRGGVSATSNEPVAALPLTSNKIVNHDDQHLEKCYFLQPLPLFEQKRAYYSRIPPD